MSGVRTGRSLQTELDRMKAAIHRAVAVYEANTGGVAPVTTIAVHAYDNGAGGREIKVRCNVRIGNDA